MKFNNLLVFFGHHKCASTWISDIISEVCRQLCLKWIYVHDPISFRMYLDANENVDFLIVANAEIEFINKLFNFRGFHVIRDPRDIIISGYFSHLYSHPLEKWLVEQRKNLQNLTKDEGLFIEMEFAKKIFECMYNWDYSKKNILEIKFETLVKYPYNSFMEAFNFLGLVDKTKYNSKLQIACNCSLTRKIRQQDLRKIILNNSFSKKTLGRKPGEEDIMNHYRKGVIGDWVNHFNSDHRAFFKELYNDLLIKLGYEKSTDW